MHKLLFSALVLSLAVLIAGVGFTSNTAQSGEKGDKGKKEHDHHAMMLDKCAAVCNECQLACDSCATHCVHLLARGKKEHATTLQTCRDCATLCHAAASIVASHGPFVELICKSCAEGCVRCAKECERFPDDTHMKQCAETCHKCDKACREMLQHAAAAPKAE
jgi:hypothetical protein